MKKSEAPMYEVRVGKTYVHKVDDHGDSPHLLVTKLSAKKMMVSYIFIDNNGFKGSGKLPTKDFMSVVRELK